MSSEQSRHPTFLTVAPRFIVHDVGASTGGSHVQLNSSLEPAKGHSACWIGVTNIEALYQQYLPTQSLQCPLEAKPWG